MEGACNVRDLGGYPAADGRTTQWGRIYRADGLQRLTDQDQEAILARGVRKVIDLRHGRELMQWPNVFTDSAKLAYSNVSLINPASPTSSFNARTLGDMYVHMLDHVQEQLLRVFELLSEDAEEPVLFHCAAGKDRTGVVAALLLSLAGVPRETIVDDYELTAECILPIMDELRAGRPEHLPPDEYERFLGCDRENMEQMLMHLREVYGNAEQYLLAIGLPKERVDTLYRKLLGA